MPAYLVHKRAFFAIKPASTAAEVFRQALIAVKALASELS